MPTFVGIISDQTHAQVPMIVTKSHRISLGILLALAFAPLFAHAQPSDISQIQAIAADALNDLDHGEINSASNKIMQATQILKLREWDSTQTANIHLAQGIINYNKYRYLDAELAKSSTLESFQKALKLSPDIEFPQKYYSEEIIEIFKQAQSQNAEPQPPIPLPEAEPPLPAPAQDTPDTPTLSHVPLESCDTCQPCIVSVTAPPHKDIYKVQLLYASDVFQDYEIIEMHPSEADPDIFTATLPNLKSESDHIYYYIQALDRLSNVVVKFPYQAPPVNLAFQKTCGPGNAYPISENAPDALDFATTALPTEPDDTQSAAIHQSASAPIAQFSLMLGTGFGHVSDKTINCDGNPKCMTNGGGTSSIASTLAPLPLHLRLNAFYNLPLYFQVGIYLRGQLINIVKPTLTPKAQSEIAHPGVYNVMLGVAARWFILHEQPYRLHVGLGLGWGGANATVNMGPAFNNFKDIYIYKGPMHIAPEIGFLWSFHQNVGLAVELEIPIVFPERPSFFIDLSVGPYFQF